VRKFFLSLVFIFGVFISTTAFGETYISGHITEDTTWDLAGSPYITTNDVYIDPNITVTLGSGAQLTLDYHDDLTVDGSLVISSSSRLYIKYYTNLQFCSALHLLLLIL